MTAFLSNPPRWCLPALLTVVALLFITRNLPWHLDDYDQAKQAYVSHEMVRQGHWWYQHTPSGNIATKPPLSGWISAALSIFTGGRVGDFAWRLPPLLSAAVIIWLLVRVGRQIGGEMAAIVAVAAFALNLSTPRLATLVRTDMLLAFTIFVVGYLVFQKLRTRTPWTRTEKWSVFAALLASMLTKGPIAYAFLLPGIVAFQWLQRAEPSRAKVWSGWWSWFGPLLFFGAWAGMGIWLSPEFNEQVVHREFLGRFTTGEKAVHNNQPVYFYVAHLLHRFFPWSVLLVVMCCRGETWRRLRAEPEYLWLLCWGIGGLLVMSLVPSKRGDRVFPVVPPLCLLTAAVLTLRNAQDTARFSTRRLMITVMAIALVFSGSYGVYSAVKAFRENDQALVTFSNEALARLKGEPFAIVSGKDEGMLLYLQADSFTKPNDALKRWREGELRALVLPLSQYERRREELGIHECLVQSSPAKNKQSEYILVVRPDTKQYFMP